MGKHRLQVIDEVLSKVGDNFSVTLRKKDNTFRSRQLYAKQDAAKAGRFIFDDEASTYLGQFIKDFPRCIIDHRQFAMPPTDPCYIEFNAQVLNKSLGISTDVILPDTKEDGRLGYLFSDGWVLVFCKSSDDTLPANFVPIIIDLKGRMGSQDYSGIDLKSKLLWLYFILGSMANDVKDEEEMLTLLDEYQFVITDVVKQTLTSEMVYGGWNGHVRDILATLLLLNQHKSHINANVVEPRPVIIKGKRQVIPRHTIVNLAPCSKDEMHRRILDGRRETPRLHHVRGHFKHFNVDEDCDHVWPLKANNQGRWYCNKCNGFRRWWKEMQRGDKSKGVVNRSYTMVKG